MSINLSEIKDRLRPFLMTHWEPDVLDLMVDDDFLNIFNDVANDLNDEGQINLERFYAKTGSTHAEDSNYTNYLMAGDISKVLSFWYEAADWDDQYYSYTADRIILKETASSGIQMDIRYLRKCEDLVDPTDEVDLPDEVIPEYMELLKKRLLTDYGTQKVESYESALMFYSSKAYGKMNVRIIEKRLSKTWMGQVGGDNYDITNNYISLDNFVSGVDDNYSYIT